MTYDFRHQRSDFLEHVLFHPALQLVAPLPHDALGPAYSASLRNGTTLSDVPPTMHSRASVGSGTT